jgi:RNA polymerase sigma-70 factor, ECF subfamily
VPAPPRRTGPVLPANPSVISRLLFRTEARAAAAPDEAALVARLAAGDREEALAALYDLYGRRLYALGVHLLHDCGLAEDLVQETFVRLWRSADRYDPRRSSVRTFVYTLARRAAVDLWRRSSREPATAADGLDPEDGVGGAAFDDVMLRLDVGEALEALTPAHREVLELQYHGDLTSRQVAERLGIPLGTVKTRTLYALHSLSTELKERGLID